MASTAASASPSIWRRGEHEVSLVRLYVLRAVALFFAVDGFFSKLPDVIHPDPASRGIIASMLAALWVSAFFVLRYPLRMMPVFLFELIWKTLWLIDYGLPQLLGGTGSPRLNRDLFEIGFFPIVIALIIPWGYVWRRYVRQPAEPRHRPGTEASPGAGERGTNEVSATRLDLVRATFLLLAIAGCFLILPVMIRPDPVARGMLESMLAGLWVCSFLGLRYPLQMLPILLFEFVSTTLWLIDYGLPRGLSGAAAPQFQSDLLAIGGGPDPVRAPHPMGLCLAPLYQAAGGALALTGKHPLSTHCEHSRHSESAMFPSELLNYCDSLGTESEGSSNDEGDDGQVAGSKPANIE